MKKLLALLSFLSLGALLPAQSLKKPDLAYPKTVQAEAEKALKLAEKKGNGDLLVAALCQLSLAECAISQENNEQVFERLHLYQAKERRTDILALLRLLEYRILDDVWMTGVDRDSVLARSLEAGASTLSQYPLSDYPECIDPGNKEAQKYVTNLYEMIHPGEPLATAQGLMRNSISKDNIGQYEAYLKQYPEGPYAYEIEKSVHRYWTRTLSVTTELQHPTGLPIEIEVNGRHSKQAILVVYALPDTTDIVFARSRSNKEVTYPVKEVLRKNIELNCDEEGHSNQKLELPLLPYGFYCIDIFDREHPNKIQRQLTPSQYRLFSVSNLYPFTVLDYTGPTTTNLVVDNWSGKPVEGAKFVEGCPVSGEDRYSYFRVEDYKIKKAEYQAQAYDNVKFFTDLAIYRPGERVQWHLVAYLPRLYNHQVDKDARILVVVKDAQGEEINRALVTTDAMGMARGAFTLPKGDKVPLGDYSFEIEQIGYSQNKQYHSIEVAEYKAPTFDIVFDPFASKYKRTDTVQVCGTVKTLVGVAMPGQCVSLRIDGGDTLIEEELHTDEEGRFSFAVPMETLLTDTLQWNYWHWFTATAHVTNAGGESQEAQCGFHYAADTKRPYLTAQERPDTCPAGVPLWVARADQQLESDDQGNAIVPIYNSVPEAYIYYMAYDRDQLLHQGWEHFSDTGRHELKLPMVRKGSCVEMTVSLFSRFHGCNYNAQSIVTLKERKLIVDTEVMRDHLLPGTTETWYLRAHYDDQEQTPARARLMLLLYHSAIGKLRANQWSFYPQTDRGPGLERLQESSFYWGNPKRYSWTEKTQRKQHPIELPCLQTWGNRFHEYHPIYIRGMANSPVMKTLMTDAAVDFSADDLAQQVQMRDSMTHVALYEPALDTDAEGRATVTFNVPQDNATWLLEAVGYDEMLHTTDLHKKIVVRRPVMVKPALPRFVRKGDRCTLSGLVQNASEDSLEATVQVEIFHPLSKEVLLQKTEKMQLAVNEERALGITLQVPDTLDEIGFRIVAVAEGCSDGEQLRLPILAAAQPIVDSYPFYVHQGADISQIKDSLWHVAGCPEKYTFEAVTNLKDYLRPQLEKVYDKDASSATAIAHSLWAQVVVNHLCDTVGENSVLVERLNGLQNADGGYSWCDYENRKSSDYVTCTVMYLMERLETMGYETPEGLHLDRVRQYLKDSTDYYSHTLKKKWYIRRHWRQMSLADRGFAAQYLYENASGIVGCFNKCTARKIARSIMEYQKEDDYYGGYWSIEHARNWNMPLGCCCCIWRPLLYHDQLALTAHLTEVLNEVDPVKYHEAIKRSRQWMMMSKRTTDWGNSSLVADAAYALLRTGDVWDDSSHPVWGALQVSKVVPVREVEKHSMHEVTVDVKPLEALVVGKKIKVEVQVEATQNMDYVTIIIPRPACLEPLRQTSGHFWQSGLWGKCETRDTETRLYLPHLTAGKHTLSFEAYVTHEGEFAQPAVTLTCEYNPQFTVHSAGTSIEVK